MSARSMIIYPSSQSLRHLYKHNGLFPTTTVTFISSYTLWTESDSATATSKLRHLSDNHTKRTINLMYSVSHGETNAASSAQFNVKASWTVWGLSITGSIDESAPPPSFLTHGLDLISSKVRLQWSVHPEHCPVTLCAPRTLSGDTVRTQNTVSWNCTHPEHCLVTLYVPRTLSRDTVRTQNTVSWHCAHPEHCPVTLCAPRTLSGDTVRTQNTGDTVRTQNTVWWHCSHPEHCLVTLFAPRTLSGDTVRTQNTVWWHCSHPEHCLVTLFAPRTLSGDTLFLLRCVPWPATSQT